MPGSEHYDCVVIGGGSGGYAAARTAREHRDRVAIVDDSEELGGLCILKGCMPSKTVIYSAEILHHARHGEKFGLRIPTAEADMKAVLQRKRAMVEDFASYRRDQLLSDRFTLIRERGSFVDESTLQLSSGRTLTADFFVVATGSVVNVPPVKGLDLPGVWTSDEVLEMDELPDTTIVLGGGIVACELGQYLQRIGSQVIQIQRSPQILKEFDPAVSELLMSVLRAEGIELYTDTKLEGVERTDRGFAAVFMHEGEMKRVEAARLVNALGRRPNTDALGLDQAGVELRRSGHIVTSSFQQSTNPRIYAAGDVAGPHEIVHIAIMQGEVAARHALTVPTSEVDYSTMTQVLFTDPQVAHVGISERKLQTEGRPYKVAEYPFGDHGKSILMEARSGHVKVWCDPETGRILGAECVGKDAGELIHAMAVGVSLGATAMDLLKVHWYHPTLSEIWSYPLEDLAGL